MAERIRALWQRIKEDIRRNPGLWIGVGISAVILVIAYLAYRQNQASSLAQVPANGYGYPDYGSASGGGGGGSTSSLGYTPYQTSDPTAPSNYVVSPSGVTSVASATPALPSYTPSYPAFSLSPFTFAPTASSSTPVKTMIEHAAPVKTMIDTGYATSPVKHLFDQSPIPPVKHMTDSGYTTSSAPPPDAMHPAVTSHPATQLPAPNYTVPHVNTFIPTTIRPQTVTTRGRVA